MSQTYQTEGIILKAMAMGEADRLVTILSPDRGLIKAIAPGARKPKSKLGGRTSLFVVNHVMCLSGRSLDRLLQADVQETFPGLSQNLAKLTTAQYWAELVLSQSLDHHPEPQLYTQQLQLLRTLECCPADDVLFQLIEGIGQLLSIAGITPELQHCCRSEHPIGAETLTQGKGVYFSCSDGGTVLGDVLRSEDIANQQLNAAKTDYTRTSGSLIQSHYPVRESVLRSQQFRLTLPQWIILSSISPHHSCSEALRQNPKDLGYKAWLAVEKILREYAQHHFERPIRSATLVESVFAHLSPSKPIP